MITLDEVINIRKLAELGYSSRQISEDLIISKSKVLRVCKEEGIFLYNTKTKRLIPEELFHPVLNSDVSWVMGLIATDGWLSKSNNTLETRSFF